RTGAGAPHHRDDLVPRDGHDVLAGAGGDADEGADVKPGKRPLAHRSLNGPDRRKDEAEPRTTASPIRRIRTWIAVLLCKPSGWWSTLLGYGLLSEEPNRLPRDHDGFRCAWLTRQAVPPGSNELPSQPALCPSYGT